MARKESNNTSFSDLVARLKDMSNMTPDQERKELMEAANSEPKVLDDKEVTLADIAKLAGIKEYTEAPKVSEKAEKLVESITKEDNQSVITKAIKESDADTSISTNIRKAVNEESKRLDKIAELEQQLAELKSQEKQDATMDDKAFREAFTKEVTSSLPGGAIKFVSNFFSINFCKFFFTPKNLLLPIFSILVSSAKLKIAAAKSDDGFNFE